LALTFRHKLNLNDFPVFAISRDLQQTDRIASLEQDLCTLEPIPQASKMVGLVRAFAGRLQMLIHRLATKAHEKWDIGFLCSATGEIHMSSLSKRPNASITGSWNGAKRSVSRPAPKARS
jgi:hypothetical protein